jgi:hypothetical protein
MHPLQPTQSVCLFVARSCPFALITVRSQGCPIPRSVVCSMVEGLPLFPGFAGTSPDEPDTARWIPVVLLAARYSPLDTGCSS